MEFKEELELDIDAEKNTLKPSEFKEESLIHHLQTLFKSYENTDAETFITEANAIVIFTSKSSRFIYTEIFNHANFHLFLVDSFKNAVKTLLFIENSDIFYTLLKLLNFAFNNYKGFDIFFVNSNCLEYCETLIITPTYPHKSFIFLLFANFLQNSPSSLLKFDIQFNFDSLFNCIAKILENQTVIDSYYILQFIQVYCSCFQVSSEHTSKLLHLIFLILEYYSDATKDTIEFDQDCFSRVSILSLFNSILSNYDNDSKSDVREIITANCLPLHAIYDFTNSIDEQTKIEAIKLLSVLEKLQMNDQREMCFEMFSKDIMNASNELVKYELKFFKHYLQNSEFNPDKNFEIVTGIINSFDGFAAEIKICYVKLIFWILSRLPPSYIESMDKHRVIDVVIDVFDLNDEKARNFSLKILDILINSICSSGIDVLKFFEDCGCLDDFQTIIEESLSSDYATNAQIAQKISTVLFT